MGRKHLRNWSRTDTWKEDPSRFMSIRIGHGVQIRLSIRPVLSPRTGKYDSLDSGHCLLVNEPEMVVYPSARHKT